MTAIGLIGYGRWGRHIFRDLVALGAEVHVGVPSEASRQAALAAGAFSVHESLADLPPVEGYVVATPTATHAAIVEALLRSGRPIFVEKPLTSDAAAARRLVREAGERIFVMDKWRYHPGIEALAEQARSGALGEIVAIRSYRLGWGNPHRDVDGCWILMPHDLSIAIEILGRLPRPKAAFTTVPGGDAVSNLIAILQDSDGGPLVTAEIATGQPAARRSVTVVGTRGSAQLADSYDDRILVAMAGDKAATEISVSSELPLLRELRAFLCHLRGGPPPRSSAADGLAVVEAIEALRGLAGSAPGSAP